MPRQRSTGKAATAAGPSIASFDGCTSDVPVAMQDTEDFDALPGDPVERQIPARDEVPDARPDVVPGDARIGMLRELAPSALDRIEDAVGSGGTVLCDVEPDLDQILVGAGRAQDSRHVRSDRPASCRRRASAFTSSMPPRRLGPLSIPSLTKPRRSSML